MVLAGGAAGSERRTTAAEFDVRPLTRYGLSFAADVGAGETAAWELQVCTAEGPLPFEGLFNADWQRLGPGQGRYTHQFLTPRDGTRLKLLLKHDGQPPRLGVIELQPITNANPVINGDFSAGPGNYSGWNDRHLAQLETNEQGVIVLRCDSAGYALTDPIPVEAGATYRYAPGSTEGRVLVYDRDLLRTGWIDDYDVRRNPVLKMPPEAAFIRIMYGDGRAGRAPVIRQVGIERVEPGPATAARIYPPYPGEIVLDPRAALPEIRAAREIQHWVRQISGKEMRVLAEAGPGASTKIFVGRAWAEALFPADLKALEGSDGYAVRQTGARIYVFGARPAGALFGACRFIEANTDLIWARPRQAFGTVYSENPDLVFTNANLFQRPAFAYRMCGAPYAARSDDGIWQGRAGMNTTPYYNNRFPRGEMGGAPAFEHNFMGTIAQNPKHAFDTCKVEHPEFFALVNGKRQIAHNGYTCYTAPGIAEAIAEGLCTVMRRAEAHGESLEHLHIRTRDGWTVCSCPDCMRPIELSDGTRLEPRAETAQQDPLFFSTRMAIMLNRVAEVFARSYPDVRIGIPAYIYSAEPPAIEHVPSLIPTFCAYDTSSPRFPILEGTNNPFATGRVWENRFRTYLERNGRDNRQLSYFSYHYIAGFCTVADSAAADWRAMVESGGVHGIHLDGFTSDDPALEKPGQYAYMWDFQAAERWVIARLAWDPTLDPQELRTTYIRRAYREAAPEMLQFHQIIRDVWRDPANRAAINCHTPPAAVFEAFVVRPGHEERLRALLVRAERQAAHPASRTLVQRTLAAFDRFAESLNRIYIPFIREATAEWNLAHSTFWMQALSLGDFKRVSTWEDFGAAPVLHPTRVSLMRDADHVYIRMQALKAGANDRAELVLTAARFSTAFYFAIDRDGKCYGMRDNTPWEHADWQAEATPEGDGYAALFKIPLALIRGLDVTGDEVVIYAKFSRLVAGDAAEAEESSLTGDALTKIHYMNYWTALSIQMGEDAR